MTYRRVLLLALVLAMLVPTSAAVAQNGPSTDPFVRVTYLCSAPADGTYDLYADAAQGNIATDLAAGDYVFRVRYESGDADPVSAMLKVGNSPIAGPIELSPGDIVFVPVDVDAKGVKAELDDGATTNASKGTASTNDTECTPTDDGSGADGCEEGEEPDSYLLRKYKAKVFDAKAEFHRARADLFDARADAVWSKHRKAKWAQRKIERARADVVDAKEDVAEAEEALEQVKNCEVPEGEDDKHHKRRHRHRHDHGHKWGHWGHWKHW